MTTPLERFRDENAKVLLDESAEKAVRVRRVATYSGGVTSFDDSDQKAVRGVVTARSGDVKEQGWGQTAEGDFMAVVDLADDYTEGDFYDPSEGVWEGYRFRVTFVDRQGSMLALERVTEDNA